MEKGKNRAPLISKGNVLVFAMLVSCFTLWGLLNNMTDNLVPSFQRIFTMDQSKAGLVQVAFYGAYAVLAIFAAILAEEFSYRKGVLIGLFVYVAGALLYIPACIAQSFEIYFIAIFIVAGGCSLLETTCNPYVLSLGDQSTAVRRLNFAQMFNPVGSLAGIVLAQQLILSHLNPATAEERALMDAATRQSVIHEELFWVCAPYVGLCAIAALIWLCFFMAKDREGASAAVEPQAGRAASWARVGVAALFTFGPVTALYFAFPEMDKIAWVLCGCLGPVAYVLVQRDYRAMLRTLLTTPRYFLGVVTQFFYVGVQIAAWTWLNVYCQKELGATPAQGGVYYTVAIVVHTVGRWAGTYAMKFFEPARIMAVLALCAVLTCVGAMYLPSDVVFTAFGLPFAWNVVCLVLMSGFMSVMFPTIYGIALGRLDPKALKLGASGLIMAILGGAIITPWMASVIGNPDSAWCALVKCCGFATEWDPDLRLTQESLRASFAIPAVCFAVVGLYALCFMERRRRAATAGDAG